VKQVITNENIMKSYDQIWLLCLVETIHLSQLQLRNILIIWNRNLTVLLILLILHYA